LIRGLNKIHFNVPGWVPGAGGKSFGINIGEIPLLAKGGVIDKATLAMLGESGKEAVVPLEKNTGWIRSLSKELISEVLNQQRRAGLGYSGGTYTTIDKSVTTSPIVFKGNYSFGNKSDINYFMNQAALLIRRKQ